MDAKERKRLYNIEYRKRKKLESDMPSFENIMKVEKIYAESPKKVDKVDTKDKKNSQSIEKVNKSIEKVIESEAEGEYFDMTEEELNTYIEAMANEKANAIIQSKEAFFLQKNQEPKKEQKETKPLIQWREIISSTMISLIPMMVTNGAVYLFSTKKQSQTSKPESQTTSNTASQMPSQLIQHTLF